MALDEDVAVGDGIEPAGERQHIEDGARRADGVCPRRLDFAENRNHLRGVLFDRDQNHRVPHVAGGDQPVLDRDPGLGRRHSRDLYVSRAFDGNLAGIGDPGMLLHFRSIGHLNVQLIAGADEKALVSGLRRRGKREGEGEQQKTGACEPGERTDR